MDFTTLTVQILVGLKNILGNYGLAIILLTAAIRTAMWPLGVSQQKSMRKMQELQPKLKELQARYKSNPQMLQQKMMEFYKEHSFNPFGGCFPMLVQLPIFIMLYTALISPQFSGIAGDSSFLFIHRLDAPLKSRAGVHADGKFAVEKGDNFEISKTAKVFTKDGVIEKVEIEKHKDSFEIEGNVKPTYPLEMSINIDSLDLPYGTEVVNAEASVTNLKTKEFETIKFMPEGKILKATVATEKVSEQFHFDVLILIALFGASMFASQKLMTKSSNTDQMDPTQKMMQEQMSKMMPIMITVMFVFFPIPAGVLLYMVVSNLFQMAQSYFTNKQLDAEYATPSNVSNANINNAKKIEPKDK